jgi:hypothetical protein
VLSVQSLLYELIDRRSWTEEIAITGFRSLHPRLSDIDLILKPFTNKASTGGFP